MKPVRCAICGTAYVADGTTVLLQSARFPTVFTHGGPCWASISSTFAKEGFEWNILCEELMSNDIAIGKGISIPISNLRESLAKKRAMSAAVRKANAI